MTKLKIPDAFTNYAGAGCAISWIEDGFEKENLTKLIIKILEINGLDDAIWCLRWLPEKHIKTVRLFTCDIAEHVLHLFEDEFPEDKRPSKAINTARLYAEGKCTGEELRAAWCASLKAAVTSASNAEAAPWAADAVTDASNAEAAAWAAYAAADAAAYASAWAAEAAAKAAAEAAAEAAADAASAWVAALRGVATKAAAEAAAEAAANAARAAEAAEAAGKTTLKEEKMRQTELFIKYFG